MLSFTRNLIKSFFRAFDAYNTLCDFLIYFPLKYAIVLVCEDELLIDLI